MDPVQWIPYVQHEIAKGKHARQVRENGMETIFCLDVSGSMKGVAWEQAKQFIVQFIKGK